MDDILDSLKAMTGLEPDTARDYVEAQPRALETPADTATRLDRSRTTQHQAAIIKARDLSSRGIAHFSTADGGVQEVTDPAGAPITQFNPRSGIGYGGDGAPVKVSPDVSGVPKLSDPYAVPDWTDPKTGDTYKRPNGLPWKWTGQDEATVGALKGKRVAAINRETDSALAEPEQEAKAQAMAAGKAVKQSVKATGQQFAQLGVPLSDDTGRPVVDLANPDPNALKSHIEKSFNAEFGSAPANEKPWFGNGKFSPAAETLRADIQKRKDAALALADQHLATVAQAGESRSILDQIAGQRRALKGDRLKAVNEKRVAEGLAPVSVPTIPGIDDGPQMAENTQQQGELDSSPTPATISAGHGAPGEPATGSSLPLETPGSEPGTTASQAESPDVLPTKAPTAESALGSLLRPIATGIVPAAGTALGGIGGATLAGTAGLPSGPGAIAAAIAGDIAGGAAGGAIAEKAQNAVMGGVMGGEWTKENEAQMAANMAAHPIAAKIGAFVPAIISMLGGGGGKVLKTAGEDLAGAVGKWLGHTAERTATNPAYLTKAIAALPESMTIGARMGAGAASQNAAGGRGDYSDILGEAVKGAVTMGPVAFVPAAGTILGGVFGKAPADAAILATANALYEKAVHGKEINGDELARDIGTDIPGFMVAALLGGLTHARPVDPRRGGEPENPANEPATPPETPPQQGATTEPEGKSPAPDEAAGASAADTVQSLKEVPPVDEGPHTADNAYGQRQVDIHDAFAGVKPKEDEDNRDRLRKRGWNEEEIQRMTPDERAREAENKPTIEEDRPDKVNTPSKDIDQITEWADDADAEYLGRTPNGKDSFQDRYTGERFDLKSGTVRPESLAAAQRRRASERPEASPPKDEEPAVEIPGLTNFGGALERAGAVRDTKIAKDRHAKIVALANANGVRYTGTKPNGKEGFTELETGEHFALKPGDALKPEQIRNAAGAKRSQRIPGIDPSSPPSAEKQQTPVQSPTTAEAAAVPDNGVPARESSGTAAPAVDEPSSAESRSPKAPSGAPAGEGSAEQNVPRGTAAEPSRKPVAGPALLDAAGKVVAQGRIGQSHADLIREAAAKGEDLTDATHAFVDQGGAVLSRHEAAARARDTGQISAQHYKAAMGRKTEPGLHSQDLRSTEIPKAVPGAKPAGAESSNVKPQPGAAEKPDGLAPAKKTSDDHEKRGSTQVTLEKKDAEPILAFAKSIPEADLYRGEEGSDSYGSDGYGIEDKPHVTSLYGLTGAGDNAAAVEAAAKKAGIDKVTLKLGKISAFENKGAPYDVLKVDVHSPDLHKLNAALKTLPFKSDFPDYHPHLTIAYLKKGAAAKYVGDSRFEGKEITFDTLTHSSSDREKTRVKLAKESAPAIPGLDKAKAEGAAEGAVGVDSNLDINERHPQVAPLVKKANLLNDAANKALVRRMDIEDKLQSGTTPLEQRVKLRAELTKAKVAHTRADKAASSAATDVGMKISELKKARAREQRTAPKPAAVETTAAAAAEIKSEMAPTSDNRRSRKEIKAELVQLLKDAIKRQPKGKTVEIQIPGDGSFKVLNTKDALGDVLRRVEKMKTVLKPVGPPKGSTGIGRTDAEHLAAQAREQIGTRDAAIKWLRENSKDATKSEKEINEKAIDILKKQGGDAKPNAVTKSAEERRLDDANAAFKKASSTYDWATKQYRAKTMSDGEFLGYRSEFEAAKKEVEEAESAQAKQQKPPSSKEPEPVAPEQPVTRKPHEIINDPKATERLKFTPDTTQVQATRMGRDKPDAPVPLKNLDTLAGGGPYKKIVGLDRKGNETGKPEVIQPNKSNEQSAIPTSSKPVREISAPSGGSSGEGDLHAVIRKAVAETQGVARALGTKIEAVEPGSWQSGKLRRSNTSAIFNPRDKTIYYDPDRLARAAGEDHVRAVLAEELIHAAQYKVASEQLGKQSEHSDVDSLIAEKYRGIVDDLAKTQRGRDAIKASLQAYLTDTNAEPENFSPERAAKFAKDNFRYALELERQLVQIRRNGIPTEEAMRSPMQRLTRWIQDVLNTLKRLAADPKSDSPVLEDSIKQIESTLDAAAKGDALQSLSDRPPAKSVAQKGVQAIADRLARDFKGAPKVEVVADGRDLPAAVRAEAEKRGIDPNRIGGVVSDGKVFLNAAGLESPQRAVEVWYHEVASHLGVSPLLDGIDPRASASLARILEKSFPSEWQHVAERYHENERIDETLARIMEKFGPQNAARPAAWRRVVDYIRTVLAKAGLKQWSNGDVEALLRRGLEKVRKASDDTSTARESNQSREPDQVGAGSVPVERAAEAARGVAKVFGAEVVRADREQSEAMGDRVARYDPAANRIVYQPSGKGVVSEAHLRSVFSEELIHAAQRHVVVEEAGGSPGDGKAVRYLEKKYRAIVDDLNKTNRGKALLLASERAYGYGPEETPQRMTLEQGAEFASTYTEAPIEMERQLVQLRNAGRLTEETMRSAEQKLRGWFTRTLSILKRNAKEPGKASPILDESIRRVEDALRGAEPERVAKDGVGETKQGTWFSTSDDKNLVAVHNLSIDNLRHALKMGGIPVPSMAVIRTDRSKFDNFGEISLVADKSLIDPKRDKAAKVFNADVYSPRYPSVETKWLNKEKTFKKFEQLAAKAPEAWRRNVGHWSEDVEIRREGLQKAVEDANLPKLAWAVQTGKALPEVPEANKGYEQGYMMSELRTLARTHEAEFQKWIEDFLAENPPETKERIFDGYTYSGDGKYLKHDLDTVVRILKRKLQDGEGFNYGVPSIRAGVAKKFRSVEQMQKARGDVIDADSMKKIKEEADAEFMKLAEESLPLRSTGGDGFGALDAFSDDMKSLAEGGAENWKHLREMYPGGEPFTKMREFLEKLKHLPTEYFEAKIQRAVGIHEFAGAVVPDSTPADLRSALEKRGLDVVEYPKGNADARQKAVEQLSDKANIKFSIGDEPAEPHPSHAQPREEDGSFAPKFALSDLWKSAADTIDQAKDEWKSRPVKDRIVAGYDAGSNAANNKGEQAANSIRLDLPDAKDREAMPFVIEAGGDAAKLQQFKADIAASNDPKLAKKYEPIIDRAIAEFPRLNAARSNHDSIMADNLAELKAAGVDVGEVEDYVTRKLDQPENVQSLLPNPLFATGTGKGSNPRYFTKGRAFETLAEAIKAGFRPKGTDLADLDGHRIAAANRILEQKRYIEELKNTKAPTDGKPIIGELETRKTLSGKDEQVVPKGYRMVQIAGRPVVVHEQFADTFQNLFGQSAIRSNILGRALLKAAAATKSYTLAFDTFHVGRLLYKMASAAGEGPLAIRDGKVGWNIHKGLSVLEYADKDLGRAVQQKLITQGEADYARRVRPKTEELIKAGLNVGNVADNLMQQAKVHLPIVGGLNDWIFQKLSRGAMLQASIKAYDRNISRGLPREQAARQTAKEMNELFGNLQNQGLFTNKTLQDVARLVFLAPQWTESQFRYEARAYGQAPRLVKGLVTGKGIQANSASALAAGFVGLLAANQVINYLSRGQSTFQNQEDGHLLDGWIPGGKRGFFLNPAEIAGEYAHAAFKYAAQNEHPVDIASHIASNKLSPIARGVKDIATGRDYAGRHYLNDTDRMRAGIVDALPSPIPLGGWVEKDPRQPLGYRVTRRAGGVGPSLQKQLLQSVGAKLTEAQSPRSQMFAIAQNFRADRGKTDTAGEYTELRRALDLDEKEAVQSETKWLLDRGKPLETIRAAVGLKKDGSVRRELFSGSAEREAEMLRSLTPKERGIYNHAQNDHVANARKFEQWSRGIQGPRPAMRDFTLEHAG